MFQSAAAPSASADINGKYLETYHYTCQSSGIYHDAYGPTTGYRAYGSYCHSKTSFHSGYIRLVTSCSWGFTYYSDWVWVDPASSGWNPSVSPKESEMGCTWGRLHRLARGTIGRYRLCLVTGRGSWPGGGNDGE